MTAEEKLMAYVDGELPSEERESFRATIAQDGHLQNALAREKLLRRKVAEFNRSALDEEVPERLTRLLSPRQATPTLLRPPASKKSNSVVQNGWWKNVTAIAASLVLGLFLGQTLNRETAGTGAGLAAVPDEQLAQALETQLASNQTPADPVQIGATFISADGQPCRTYESSGSAGLACRSGGEWELKLIAPGAGPRTSEYQQAGSASELVMRSAQEMLADGPMDMAQERQARDAGWPTSDTP